MGCWLSFPPFSGLVFKPMVTWGTPHFGKPPNLCSIEPTQIPVSILVQNLLIKERKRCLTQLKGTHMNEALRNAGKSWPLAQVYLWSFDEHHSSSVHLHTRADSQRSRQSSACPGQHHILSCHHPDGLVMQRTHFGDGLEIGNSVLVQRTPNLGSCCWFS